MKKRVSILVFLFCNYFCFAHTKNNHGERHYKFIENKGQWALSVSHQAKINGGVLFLEKDRFTFHLQDNSVINRAHWGEKIPANENYVRGHAYQLIFENSNTKKIIHTGKSSEYYNYFIGNVKEKWASTCYAYSEVVYDNIYAGINLKITTENENLKYTYYLKPQANAALIKQKYEGTEGLELKNGNLIIKTSVNQITEQKPVAWQIIKGKKVFVACDFKLINNEVTYNFPNGYNTQHELVIDPVLIFGSYTGSTADNFGMTATYDNQGHLYTGGITFNIGYPTTLGAYQTFAYANGSTYGVTDVTISKFSPTGNSLIYSTYIGGGNGIGGTETVHSLIVNDNNELYFFGVTSSPDYPTTVNAYDQTFNGGSFIGFVNNGTYFNNGTDLYVSRFDATGTNLLSSTFIGGSANDGVNHNLNFLSGGNWTSNADSLQFNYGDQFRGEIMLDNLGNVYIASTTRSADFPTVNALQNSFGGMQDAIAFKMDANLSNLIWSTYIGGNNKDAAYSIKVDDNYNAYVGGGTISADFPTTPGSLNTSFQGGKADGFICKIAANGNILLNSSFIGTSVYDQVFFVELDRFGDVYVLGQTMGNSGYPVINVNYSNNNGSQFITKLNNNLTAIIYSTRFGNGNVQPNISPSAFLVDVCGNVYVSGWGANILQSTPLNNMPVTANAFQPNSGDGFNFYLIVFERNIQSLLYATYFGGNQSREHVDGGTSRFDKNGIVYQSVCAGCGGHSDFPTTPGAWSNTNNSTNCNNGVFKFDFEISPQADFTTDLLAGCAPLTIQFTNTGTAGNYFMWDFGNGDTTTQIVNPVYTFTDTGTYVVYLIVEDTICGLLDTAQKIITVYDSLILHASNDTVLCSAQTLQLWSTSMGTSTNYIWSSNPSMNPVISTDSTINVNILNDTVFYVQVTNSWCTYVDTIQILIPELDVSITNLAGICTGDTALLTVTNFTPQFPLTYNWFPDSVIVSGDGTANILISPDYPGWVGVVGTTTEGCVVTDSVFINVNGPPSGFVNATAYPYNIPVGGSSQLNAQPGGYTYSWTPASSLNNANIQNPVASPSETTIYTVTISNNGCSLTDTVIVRILEFICDEPNIYVPNAFTPNNDGENDVLFVRSFFDMESLIFRVYDRWGEKVFETNNKSIGWDGTFRGRDCDPAVFVYYLEAKCPGGKEYFKKGNVTLIR